MLGNASYGWVFAEFDLTLSTSVSAPFLLPLSLRPPLTLLNYLFYSEPLAVPCEDYATCHILGK